MSPSPIPTAKRSIVLLSGGLDSAINLAICSQQDDPLMALTFDYGQRAALEEKKAAKNLCNFFGIPHQVWQLPFLENLSPLSPSSAELPQLELAQLHEQKRTQESAAAVWVPNRNGLMIEAAAVLAESMEAEQVVVGFNIEEAQTFPDNSEEYLEAISQALFFSTKNHVRVISYTSHETKTEMVQRAKAFPKPFPFDGVWSCYESGPTACGRCESCRRFQRAMTQEAPV